jgi:hypothetical protein
VEADTAKLRPYVALLKTAAAVGKGADDYSVVEQSGFDCLQTLMDASLTPPNCPICFQPCLFPTVTPCVHFACASCMVGTNIQSGSAVALAPRPLLSPPFPHGGHHLHRTVFDANSKW